MISHDMSDTLEDRLQSLRDKGLCCAETHQKELEKEKNLLIRPEIRNKVKQLSNLFRALANEKRIEAITLLGNNKKCSCELEYSLGLSQPTVSHHLSILEREGFVSSEKDGRYTFFTKSQDFKVILDTFQKLFNDLQETFENE